MHVPRITATTIIRKTTNPVLVKSPSWSSSLDLISLVWLPSFVWLSVTVSKVEVVVYTLVIGTESCLDDATEMVSEWVGTSAAVDIIEYTLEDDSSFIFTLKLSGVSCTDGDNDNNGESICVWSFCIVSWIVC